MVPNWGKQLVSVEELVEVLEPSDLRKVQELELRMARAKVAELEKAYPLGKDWA
jgi:hypothetical protein